MGISTNFFTIYGIKIDGYPKDFSEAYNDVYEDMDTPFAIFDGMGGKYLILGVRLFDSGDGRWGFENNDVFTEIDIARLPDLEYLYRKLFLLKFPQFGHLLNSQFKLMTLMHCS